MWSPLADNPPRSVAPASTSSIHQSDRFGGTWTPTSGISRRHSATSRFMSSIETGSAQAGQSIAPSSPLSSPGPSAQRRSLASAAMSATSAP